MICSLLIVLSWRTHGVKPHTSIVFPSHARLAGLPNRTALMYCEEVKTGSGSLKYILSEALSAFSMRGVKEYATEAHQQQHFVIASVREPCDWYVSVFAWSVCGDNGHAWKTDPDGRWTQEYSSCSQNVSHFRAWLSGRPTGTRLYSGRAMFADAAGAFYEEHGAAPNVDCWTDVADFANTLRRCLRMFEAQGGAVDWAAPKLVEALEAAPVPMTRRLQVRAPGPRNMSKNSPPSSQRARLPCHAYYDDATAGRVTVGNAVLYAAFGWQGCCQPSTDLQPRPG